ncbi:hypothetical protein HDU97_009554 [Phlyctochytrium planicorne]|nr:hypothetical protein HDU97_009554 [Phlyctochytrium planicorne]
MLDRKATEDGFMAAEIIPARTNAAIQNVVNRLGVRRAIVLIEDEPIDRQAAVPKARRRTSIASDVGFQDIISKVNTTYDMDKITPSSAPSFVQNMAAADRSVKSSHVSLTGSNSSVTDETKAVDPGYSPPTKFLRRMSVGAMDILRSFRQSTPVANEADNSGGLLPKTSAASLLPKSYVNSIYEEEEGKEEGAEGEDKDDAQLEPKTDEQRAEALPSYSPKHDTLPPVKESRIPPPPPSIAPPTIDIPEEEEISDGSDHEDQPATSTSHEPIHIETSHWELSSTAAAVQRRGSIQGSSLNPSQVSAKELMPMPPSSSTQKEPEIITKSASFLGETEAVRQSVTHSRRPSLGIPIPKSPMALTVDTKKNDKKEGLKPAKSIGALSIGGHIATPETGVPVRNRRGSGASFANSPALIIPSSPSRSDLMKIQGFSQIKGSAVFNITTDDDYDDGGTKDRTADIEEDELLMASPVSPGQRSRQPSVDKSPSSARSPSIVQIPKLPTMSRNGSTASKYIDLLGRLRGSHQSPQGNNKIKSFKRVVQVAADLKKVGEDPTLATELDTATLQMVIGLKKWARSRRLKKMETSKVQQVAQEIGTRMAMELPRTLQLDLINDAIPVVESYFHAYKRQLGEKHSFAIGCQSHLEKLKAMSRDRSFTLADMPTPEEEAAAAHAMAIHMIKMKAKSHENIQGSLMSLGSKGELYESKAKGGKTVKKYLAVKEEGP